MGGRGGGMTMRNFQMQAIFSETIPIQTFFFKRMLLQIIFCTFLAYLESLLSDPAKHLL